MSRATIDLLISSDFIVAVLIGALGLAALVVWRAASGEPVPAGGLMLTAAAVVALAYTQQVPPLLMVGLITLAAGGWVRTTAPVVRSAAAIPGAALIGMEFLGGSLIYLPATIVVVIVLLAPLVASFDRTFAAAAMAPPLVAVSLISVLFVVPDTEVALIIAGVSGLWLVSGPPAMVTHLGGAGAYAVTGLLVWDVAVGGAARPPSLVTGFATLGLLVAVPAILLIGTAKKRSEFASLTPGTWAQQLSTVAAQVAVGLLMTVVVSVGRNNLPLTIVLALGVLALAGVSVVSVWSVGSPVDRTTQDASITG